MKFIPNFFTRTTFRLKKTALAKPVCSPFFFRRICHETETIIRNLLKSKFPVSPVLLFMKGTPTEPLCGFSRAAIHILNLYAIDPAKFSTFNVLDDDRVRQGIKEYSNWPTIPQLYVNNEFIGGCDILLEMYKSGELEELLHKAGVLLGLDENMDHRV
ncbi:hypothetical protein PMAC_001097 [Pneumocystis sp. 'macacae']|nr:hypothetical protein PMAC_001097 [Pneumocystis sp. 'macacae']